MSLIPFKIYKNKFEKLLSNSYKSEAEFDATIEDLIYQVPIGALSLKKMPFLIRTSILELDEVCLNVSRCSYVPDSIKNAIPLQRCNLEHQQVFYASVAGGMTNFSDGAQVS